MRTRTVVLPLLLLGVLAACGDRDQSLPATVRKSDTPGWQSSTNVFAAPGYTSGDRATWEAQLRNRAQGQNDYAQPR